MIYLSRLLKMFDPYIVRPWKKKNVVPNHKKGDKQFLQNYWPVYLLSIYCKIFERIINSFYLNFWKKIVFSAQINLDFVHVKTRYYQSFMISMLILINIQLLKRELTFKIFQKPLTKCGMRSPYSNLDTLKYQENLLSLFKSFLSDRFQWVVLNGQCSSWSSVRASVPHDSILGPLLFLLYK